MCIKENLKMVYFLEMAKSNILTAKLSMALLSMDKNKWVGILILMVAIMMACSRIMYHKEQANFIGQMA